MPGQDKTSDPLVGTEAGSSSRRCNYVEVVGRRRQVLSGWTFQALFLGYLVLLFSLSRPPEHGRYILPLLCASWTAMTFSVALRRFGVLTASGSNSGRSTVAFACAAVLGIGVVTTTVSPPVSEWLEHAGPVTPTVVGWLVLVAVFTILSAVPWDRTESPQKSEVTTSFSKPEGTIVCCSGGGIRSAAFSLGALQRLDELGVVASSKALVAVSGGSYTAAAHAALNARTDTESGVEALDDRRPFARNTPEVSQLRKATNYLAASSRSKYDISASWFFGVLLNTAMLWGAVTLMSGLVAWQALYLNEVTIHRSVWEWPHGHVVTLGWLSLPTVGFVVFAVSRYAYGPSAWVMRPFASLIDRLDPRTRDYWAGARLTLTTLGFAVGLIVVGVPALSLMGHEAALHGEPTAPLAWVLAKVGFASPLDCKSAFKDGLTAACGGHIGASSEGPSSTFVNAVGLTASVTFFASLMRSTLKGWKEVSREASWFTRILVRYRLRIAPLVATLLFSLVILGVATAWVAAVLSHPARLDYHGRPHWFANPVNHGVLLAVAWLFDANRGSLFHFYRDRIASAFLMKRASRSEAASINRHQWPAMSSLVDKRLPAPELVLTATANIQDGDMLPTGRNGAQFVFSETQIGLHDNDLPGCESQRLISSKLYESKQARLTLADAVAVSGAAIAPLAGRESNIVAPFRILMAVANVRLGMWARNPCWVDPGPGGGHTPIGEKPRTASPAVQRAALKAVDRASRCLKALDDWQQRPTAWNVILEAVSPPSLFRPFLYLTDGGHYDNLGLVEALRRRPSRVIVLDASGDPEDGFATIGAAIATARMDSVGEIDDFRPEPLMRGKERYAKRAWVKCRVTYPDAAESLGEVVYLKSVMVPGLSWDIESYKSLHPEFPLTSTGNQLFDEFDFEAYRRLGFLLVDRTHDEGGLP
jgi:Patatin-like phospholipase